MASERTGAHRTARHPEDPRRQKEQRAVSLAVRPPCPAPLHPRSPRMPTSPACHVDSHPGPGPSWPPPPYPALRTASTANKNRIFDRGDLSQPRARARATMNRSCPHCPRERNIPPGGLKVVRAGNSERRRRGSEPPARGTLRPREMTLARTAKLPLHPSASRSPLPQGISQAMSATNHGPTRNRRSRRGQPTRTNLTSTTITTPGLNTVPPQPLFAEAHCLRHEACPSRLVKG